MVRIPSVRDGGKPIEPDKSGEVKGKATKPFDLKPAEKTLELNPEDAAVKLDLQSDASVSVRDGTYYQVTREPDPKNKGAFYITIDAYKKNPLDPKNKGIKPVKTYKDSYYVEEKEGRYYDNFTVYQVKNGQKVLDPSLKDVKKLARLPNNLGEMKKLFPKEYEKLHKALIVGIGMKIMDQEKKAQKRWKQAQRGQG